MAQVTGAAERLTGTARAQLATGLVIIAALVALGAVILAFPAHPAAVSGTAPVIPEKLIDGWQLSAPRGVGGAGSDVIDGWQLSAPRGVGGNSLNP